MLGAKVRNLDAMAIWLPRYLHPLIFNILMLSVRFILNQDNLYQECEFSLGQSHTDLSMCELSFRTGCRTRSSRSYLCDSVGRKLLNFQDSHPSGNEGLELTFTNVPLKFKEITFYNIQLCYDCYNRTEFLFFCGAAVQRGPWPPHS